MRASHDHILTSHAGSLPRPDGLIAANLAHEAGGASDERAFQRILQEAVAEVVRRQHDLGVDIPGDGEFGKPMGQRVNYGSWWRYSWGRLGGLDPHGPSLYEMEPRRSRPGEVVLTSFGDRRDRTQFAAAYSDPDSGITTGPRPPAPICVAPLTYTGAEAIRADIANFKRALDAAGVEEGFMSAVAPGSASRIGNQYYKTEEELLYACADAMREEYQAIVDAGLILQLDDPAIAENWDMINPEPTVDEYKKFSMLRVEALNHAIRGLPPDRIRFHLCWGSWHGPHLTDIPMREEYRAIVDAGLILQLDDPAIAENWDMINPEPTVQDYRTFTMLRVEALNHAIRGLPEDRIRFHLCWGSWHGPHLTDIPMRDIVEVMLAINAGASSFEAGKVRHEHEWKVWQEVRLPDHKLMLPGVVSHATNVVEHPELVADRILRFANLVGRERVIASTDCGLGGRIHSDIAWAKLEALTQGAALASRQLWH